jgi:hypothetical protein
MDKEDKIPKVYRITIDERLSEDLLRLEICELIKVDESGAFKDEPEFWKDISADGEEIVARPIDPDKKTEKESYTRLMSIPESEASQYPWNDLKEGQVYLSGSFEVKEVKDGEKTARRYFVSTGEEAFKRIDGDVKKNTEILYFETVSQGDENGKL